MNDNPYSPPTVSGTPGQTLSTLSRSFDVFISAYFFAMTLVYSVHVGTLLFMPEGQLNRTLDMLHGVSLIFAPILFLPWSFHVHKGLQKDFAQIDLLPNWAGVYGYIIPIVSFYIPYAYMAETYAGYRSIAREQGRVPTDHIVKSRHPKRSTWILGWWSLFILFLLQVVFQRLPSIKVAIVQIGIQQSVFFTGFLALESLLAFGMIIQIVVNRHRAYSVRNGV